MSGSMKASFTLTLNDKLTVGLKNIEQAFKGLDQLGHKLGFGKLETGTETLRTLGREVRELTGSFSRLGASTERAWTAVRGIAETPMHKLKGIGNKLASNGGKLQDAAMAVGGVYAIKQPLEAYAGFDKQLRQTAIKEGKSGSAVGPEVARLRLMFQRDALMSGQSSSSIAAAYQELLLLGVKPTLAQALLPIHSRAATAYNVSAEDLGPLVGSLAHNLGINEKVMPAAIASAALATKMGRVGMRSMSDYMPDITGQMGVLGMTGLSGARLAFASLETAVQNAKGPQEAATNYRDFLGAIVSPHSARAFALQSRIMSPETRAILAKYHVRGINLPALLDNARQRGIDPQTAVLRTLASVTAKLPTDVRAQVLGAFFPNKQSGDFAKAVLGHRSFYESLLGQEQLATPLMFNRDWATMFGSLSTQMDLFTEKLSQVNRRIGRGFSPLMTPLNSAMSGVLKGIHSLDTDLPGLGNAVIEVTGVLLAAASALAAAGIIAPAIKGGWGLLSGGWGAAAPFVNNPLGWIAGVGVGAYEIQKWEQAQGDKTISTSDFDPQTGAMFDPSAPGNSPSQPSAPRHVHLVVSAEPGTTARVQSASHDIHVDVNPGPATMLP